MDEKLKNEGIADPRGSSKYKEPSNSLGYRLAHPLNQRSQSELFISYSRRETPFVSRFFQTLKNAGHEAWLDFHHLVPAERWQYHITQAIKNSQIFLLVVSVESIKSENAGYEWRKAIELKKRIVLVIFEAVELPAELQNCEWIDFRTSFKQGFKKLLAQLDYPATQNAVPPQSGFKTSRTVWIAFAVSLVVSVLSLFTFWSVYIPYHLFPLPYRILKRNFVFFDVQGALLTLPLMVFASAVFIDGVIDYDSIGYNSLIGAIMLSFLTAPLMLLLLRLPGMKRWGKPMASVPMFANPYRPSTAIDIKPMKVMLDFAVEDRRYARTITRQLERCGYQIETDESSAEAIIVLISNFKKTTVYDPEKRTIFPVLLQNISDLDPKLSPIQWVDFRRGLRNLKYFCLLLSDPTKMLSALGVVPMGKQVVLPPIIQVFVYFLTLLVSLMIGGTGLSIVALGIRLEHSGEVVGVTSMLVTTLMSVFLAVSARNSLLSRQGRLATFRNLTLGLAGLVLLWIVQFLIAAFTTPAGWNEELLVDLSLTDKLNYAAGIVQGVLTPFFLVGLAFCLILSLWYWRDFYRWMPCRSKLPLKTTPEAQSEQRA
ncbi:MAG: toll/interleukin-1 receptor domain-containing protein [Cyanobacteria bacterium P01_B01_bin.77]